MFKLGDTFKKQTGEVITIIGIDAAGDYVVTSDGGNSWPLQIAEITGHGIVLLHDKYINTQVKWAFTSEFKDFTKLRVLKRRPNESRR